jgi:hypothetical protein
VLLIYSVDIELRNQKINLDKIAISRHRARFVDEFKYKIRCVSENKLRKRPVII